MNAKLGGYLVGYGLKKRNGEEKRVIFDKPIHNTITKHCLNNLLTFDGTNALAPVLNSDTYRAADIGSLFVRASNAQASRYGVINDCALGDGTGETSVNDTDLKHRVGAHTTTKKTESGWNGTSFDNNNAIVKLRISHVHVIEQDFTVKEIGWYNAISGGGLLNYTLSARVQLDEFIDVESGDEFYTIYELTLGFQGVEKFNNLAGLAGGLFTNGIYNNNDSCLPMISNSGTGIFRKVDQSNYFASGSNERTMCMIPPWVDDSIFCYVGIVKSNLPKLKPFLTTSLFQFQSISYTKTVKDYVNDSFYRDVELVVNPSAITGDVYGINVMGTLYRFGTFDEQDNFTPTPITINGALKMTVRQSWSTDLLTPTP